MTYFKSDILFDFIDKRKVKVIPTLTMWLFVECSVKYTLNALNMLVLKKYIYYIITDTFAKVQH